MSRYAYVVSGMLLLVLSILAVAAEAHPPYPLRDLNSVPYAVPVEQAMEAARAWAQDPGLALIPEGIEPRLEGTTVPYRYRLVTADGSQVFEVDCQTGEVYGWCDNVATDTYYSGLQELRKTPMLPREELHNAIIGFLASRYADFASLNMELLRPSEGSSEYYVQRLPNGAWYEGNRIICTINEWSGQIFRYHGHHSGPIAIPITPSLSAAQAEQIALDYVGTMTFEERELANGEVARWFPQSAFVLENFGLWVSLDAFGLQRLNWKIQVVVSEGPNYTAETYHLEDTTGIGVPSGPEVDIYLDAHTGEVFYAQLGGCIGGGSHKLDKATAERIKSRKPNPAALKSQPRFEKVKLEVDGAPISDPAFPPLEVGGIGYIYAKYLPALYGGTIVWEQGTTTLNVGGKRITVRPGLKAIEIGGETVPLRHETRIIAGRVYIPYDAIKHICGADAYWDAKGKILRIKSKELQPKAQFRQLQD